jgi:signal transduction histidine kinase
MAEVTFAELISKIAHELRSPLTSVKGFSSTLVKRWDRFTDEQRFQFVETIYSDAERMSRIISEVLDLARLESNQLELHKGEANVAHLASLAVQHVAALSGVERVTVDVPAQLMVWGDADRLGHVLANLIENAIKYSDEGPIQVVATGTEDAVTVTVTDQGIGIPASRLDELFAGPAPAENRAAAPSGTGLGLYLTRRLVEAHGGTISVESAAGTGSTFTLTIPARRPQGSTVD